ncbi:MAG TPA: amidohydrolase family protein [Thermoanaerobaculia bacterium]|nr:amidohydrolase family protein [Thermoanaerobaculia bacterium]
MKRAALFALASILVPLTLHAAPTLVILGGKIFTNDPAKPFVQALAIEGNKIVAVGTDEEIQALGGDAHTRRMRLGGAVVIPGINDAHTHPGVGPAGLGIATDRESTKADLVAALAGAVDEAPPDLWLIGQIGRPIMLDETVNRALLDQLAPNRKVLLRSFTGHGTIVSSRALQEAGITDTVIDPPGGRYGRNPDGMLNGRVFEYAEYALIRKVAKLTAAPGGLVTALQDFSNQALRFGITSIQAMPFDEDDATFSAALQQAGIPLRVRHIFVPLNVPPSSLPSGTDGIKWVLDGTPLEKGAALRASYPDGGGSGTLNFTNLAPLIKAGTSTNQQLLFHASGDNAIATLFKFMANTPSVNWPSLRPRVEHADGLLGDLDAQAKSLGVVAVLNPTHFEARPLFPTGRFMRAKSLLTIPIRVALGSDGPLNPYLNIMLAVSRPDGNLREALSREEAVAAYTLGSAFAEKRDDKGVLAPGKLADLAVLSQDIFTCPIGQLPNTVSILTIINGKIVLDQPAPAP